VLYIRAADRPSDPAARRPRHPAPREG